MNRALSMVLFLAFLMIGGSVFADIRPSNANYRRLPDGVARYIEVRPGHAQKAPIVMLNGLVYPTERWSPMRKELSRRGYPILNYDFRGQRWTLRAEAEATNNQPAFFRTGLDSGVMADELKMLLDDLKVNQPVTLVALSYGAHIAAEFARRYPDRVRDLVFLAPLVIPLDRYNPQGQWIMSNLDLIKLTWGPILGPLFYDAAYSQIYRSYYLQKLVPDRIPEEMRDLPSVYRESVFHLTRAARDFDLRRYDFATLRAPKVHFMTAGEEDPNAFRDQVLAFDRVHPSARGSLVHFPQASHAIPDSDGARAAAVLDLMLTRAPQVRPGTKYRMTARGLELWNGDHAITNPAR